MVCVGVNTRFWFGSSSGCVPFPFESARGGRPGVWHPLASAALRCPASPRPASPCHASRGHGSIGLPYPTEHGGRVRAPPLLHHESVNLHSVVLASMPHHEQGIVRLPEMIGILREGLPRAVVPTVHQFEGSTASVQFHSAPATLGHDRRGRAHLYVHRRMLASDALDKQHVNHVATASPTPSSARSSPWCGPPSSRLSSRPSRPPSARGSRCPIP